MNPTDPHSPQSREALRSYLLGTLGPRRTMRVEKRLQADASWRKALEEERQGLAELDLLEDEEPPRDIARAAIAQAGEEAARRQPTMRVLPGMLTTLLVLIFIGAIVVPSLFRAREASRRVSVANNLKQWATVLKMYASESGGRYPPLTPHGDYWFPDLKTLYPDYVSDMSIMVNPLHPDAEEDLERLKKLAANQPVPWEEITRIGAKHFTYPGHMVMDANDARILSASRAGPSEDGAPHGVGPQRVLPLREGIERFLITDINNPAATVKAQVHIPVMFTRIPGETDAIHVMYMDGHVELIPYGKEFPALPSVLEAFEAPPTNTPGQNSPGK